MSEVVLPTKYSASNYRPALDNLAQRYRKSGGEPVHYSEAGFDNISDEQAKVALRFFGNIGLLEVPKQGTYVPPDELVAWLRQMGPTEDEKAAVREKLMDYEVFDEMVFILNKGDLEFDELVSNVGSIVGIDKDEVKHLERALEIFDDLSFIEIRDDNTVTLPVEVDIKDSETEVGAEVDVPDEESESESEETPASTGGGTEEHQPAPPREPVSHGLQTNFQLTMDATEMDPQELEKKLSIIDGAFGHAEE